MNTDYTLTEEETARVEGEVEHEAVNKTEEN